MWIVNWDGIAYKETVHNSFKDAVDEAKFLFGGCDRSAFVEKKSEILWYMNQDKKEVTTNAKFILR